MASKNSILNDPVPYSLPKEPTVKKRAPKSDWVKLAKSKKYPEIERMLQAKMEFYRHYLPGGEAMREALANGVSDAEIGRWTQCASTIIDEIEAIRGIIQSEVENDRVQA